MPDDSTAPALCKRRVVAHTTLIYVLLSCFALICFPPSRFAFYPNCPIHEYFGLLCPGCGATRACAALLRGHFVDALRQNALFVLLLPFATFGFTRAYLRAIRPGDLRWPQIPNPALAAALLTTA